MHKSIIAFLVLTSGALAIAQDAAEAPKTSGPLTMHIAGAHPNDVFAELTKQTGVTIAVWPENLWEQHQHNNQGPPTSISVDADNKSFWDVMQQICDGSRLMPQYMGNNEGITLQWQGQRTLFGKRPIFSGESATVVAESLQRHHTIALDNDNPQPSKSCGVNLNAYVDPRLRMTKYLREPIIETAVDENGTALAQPTPASNNRDQANTNWQIQGLFVKLDYDPEKSKKLASLKGAIRITHAAEVEKLDIDLAKDLNTPKIVAGRECTVTEVTDSDHNTNVKLTIVRKDLSREEFREANNNLFQRVNLLNADGKRCNNGGGGGGGQDKLDYSFSCSWSDESKKPVKLVWEIPTKIEDADLPFEFKDLPLP